MKLNQLPANFKVGSTRDFRPAGSMKRNLFYSQPQVPSDLLLLEDARRIQIKKYFGSLAVCRFKTVIIVLICTTSI
jgi:hypothetical protein